MKWILTSNPAALVHEYHLVENETCILTLKYNPLHRTARIKCGTVYRLFFIESTGSLTGKYLLKNEYGMEIGSMNYHQLPGKDGAVQIEDKKFTYQLPNANAASIAVFEKDDREPLLHCTLDGDTNYTGMGFKNANNTESNCLLLGLCWYLFVQVAASPVMEYAS
jgi:hypothetical protein